MLQSITYILRTSLESRSFSKPLDYTMCICLLGKRGRSLENYCPIGDPLKIIETGLPFLCGNEPSKPACPPMFQCLVKNGKCHGKYNKTLFILTFFFTCLYRPRLRSMLSCILKHPKSRPVSSVTSR